MQFRWVVLITVWTFLSGPIFAPLAGSVPQSKKPAPEKREAALRPLPRQSEAGVSMRFPRV